MTDAVTWSIAATRARVLAYPQDKIWDYAATLDDRAAEVWGCVVVGGEPQAAVAQRLGVTRQAVRVRARRLADRFFAGEPWSPPRPGRRPSGRTAAVQARLDALLRLVRSGVVGAPSLAVAMEVSRTQVVRDLRQLRQDGVELPADCDGPSVNLRRSAAAVLRRKKIAKLCCDGLDRHEIAGKLSLQPSTVKRIIGRLRQQGHLPREYPTPSDWAIRRAIVLQLRRNHMTMPEIAKILRCKPKTVEHDIRWLKQHGHQFPVKEVARTVEVRALRGASYTEIAKELGITRSYVSRLLPDKLRPSSAWATKYAAVAELHEQGFRSSEIAERLAISVHDVNNRIMRLIREGKIRRSRRERVDVRERREYVAANSHRSDQDLADALSVSVNTIRAYRRHIAAEEKK